MSVEAKIIERTDAWQQAIEARDPVAAAAFLAADYALVVIQPEEVVVPRAAWLRTLPDYDVHGYVVHHRIVAAREGVATVFQVVDQTAVVMGAERSGIFVLTDVWLDEGDAWRVWRRHSAPLSASPLPVA